MALNDTHFKTAPQAVETSAPTQTTDTLASAATLPMVALAVVAVVLVIGMVWYARRGVTIKS
ncbi:MAG: hypothetical protein KUG69_06800 [Marinosulfonomonas sp.]|nr:hypothetical protein [Marinosulfonomonas sp.]